MALPTAKEVFELLEDYNVQGQVTEDWIAKERDGFIAPWVKEKTRLSFTGVEDVTEYYSGTGNSILILRRRPILELIAISYTNIPSNQFFISPLAIQVINDEGILKARANFNEANYVPIFARGERNLRVQYRYGYTDMPSDVGRAITALVAERVLAHIASRTGGGSFNVQSFGRNYGPLGKFHDARRDLARMAIASLRKYMTGVTA